MKHRLIFLGSRTIYSSFPIYWSCLTSFTNSIVYSKSSTFEYMPWVSPLNSLIHSLLCNLSSFQTYLFLKTPVLESLSYMPFASWSLSWSLTDGIFPSSECHSDEGKRFGIGQIWTLSRALSFLNLEPQANTETVWTFNSSYVYSNISCHPLWGFSGQQIHSAFYRVSSWKSLLWHFSVITILSHSIVICIFL